MAGNKQEKSEKRVSSIFSSVLIAIVSTIGSIVLAVIVVLYVSNVNASREEHATLLELVESLEAEALYAPRILSFDEEMRRINPDYVNWLRIEGTTLDHPVVRGGNNTKYLDLSFYGEENLLGTLFMDYRCAGDYTPHLIIYGHNARQGDLFGNLWMFLDKEYLLDHPIITLKANDRITEYIIFSARKTDVNDPAYFLDFDEPESFDAFIERIGAPQGASQILTLSTCVSGEDENERIIVQAAVR